MACDTPFYVLPAKWATTKVPVPCGRCAPCKLRRVNSWVFRLEQQQRISSSAHFVTLTYCGQSVPMTSNGFMTLQKYDLQKFFKRLRKLTSNQLKYYAVGEYGTKNKRPHYHAIIFNCPHPDLFDQAWSVYGSDIGAVHVGQVTSDSMAYTMKYIDKAKSYKHARDDRAPEFSIMSQGLGQNYLSDDIKKYHQADPSRMYLTKPDGHKIAMPKYYRKQIYDDTTLAKQRFIIEDAMADQQTKLLAQYHASYGRGNPFTFDDWLYSAKIGRQDSFYSQQKTRDI